MAPLEAIEKAAEGIAQSLIMCAHTHIARAVKLRDGRMVVNPGSVGLPGYRAKHPVRMSWKRARPMRATRSWNCAMETGA